MGAIKYWWILNKYCPLVVLTSQRMAAEQTEEVYHTGGCHCGAVRFRVLASPVIKAIDCK